MSFRNIASGVAFVGLLIAPTAGFASASDVPARAASDVVRPFSVVVGDGKGAGQSSARLKGFQLIGRTGHPAALSFAQAADEDCNDTNDRTDDDCKVGAVLPNTARAGAKGFASLPPAALATLVAISGGGIFMLADSSSEEQRPSPVSPP